MPLDVLLKSTIKHDKPILRNNRLCSGSSYIHSNIVDLDSGEDAGPGISVWSYFRWFRNPESMS